MYWRKVSSSFYNYFTRYLHSSCLLRRTVVQKVRVWCMVYLLITCTALHYGQEIWPCPGNVATPLITAKFFLSIRDCVNGWFPLYVDLGESITLNVIHCRCHTGYLICFIFSWYSLIILQAYFGVCWWLKFQGLAWILTACITLVLLCFFVVNFWATDLFDWR